MGIETVVAVAGLAVSAKGMMNQKAAAKDAKAASAASLAEQQKARSAQQAQAAQKDALARREEIRTERVKKAMILQSSENTGVSESSGSLGAVGAVTTLGDAAGGFAAGQTQLGKTASDALQRAADFATQAQNAQVDLSQAASLTSFGQSIFSAAGGLSAFKKS